MNNVDEQDKSSPGMTLGDIYFVLFRQKRIILLSSALGILGAIGLLLIKPPLYESDTKLFIRYVAAGQSLRPPGSENTTVSLNGQEQGIINTEVEILRSFDLARQVVEAIGAEKILARAGDGNRINDAAALVMKNMTIDVPMRGSVIPITFRHANPEIAQQVLNKAILVYFRKHADAHQPVGKMGDFLAQEIKRLREQLVVTEADLREAKNKVGVISIEEAKKGYAEQMSKVRENLFGAEADLAAQQGALGEVVRPESSKSETASALQGIPSARVNEYNSLSARFEFFSRKEQELLTQYTENSKPVKDIHALLVELSALKTTLEEKYPNLTKLVVSPLPLIGQSAGALADSASIAVQVRGLKSKIAVLRSQLRQIQADATKLNDMEPAILELSRMKDRQESDLKYFSANLEQSHIDKAMGAEAAPNIGIIEPPTPAIKKWPKSFLKKVAMVTLAGVFCGLALAFMIELVLDRSVKRGVEVETKLQMSLFMSIPDISRNGNSRWHAGTVKNKSLLSSYSKVARADSDSRGLMEVAAGDLKHPMRRFYEGLRNRLIVHFEIWNIKHKPKLVAVTSCGRGAGVSSTAAGLAASLSETGDGSVLLVDMNCERGVTQRFFNGKAVSGLGDALTAPIEKSGLVHTNLYAADENPGIDRLPEALPRRFASLMPKFKASDYDFIIFDMPPVTQTSVTARLAGFMDMVLLVIESEKSNRDVVRRANALLVESNAKVRAVLNKTRSYVPARLYQELLDDQ